jgi:riboflavin kinase/FMN adenylyltransferase
VNWIHFLRPEVKFGSLDELRQQIATDSQNAWDFFKKARPNEFPNDA